MKKIIVIVLMLFMASTTVYSQTNVSDVSQKDTTEIAKQVVENTTHSSSVIKTEMSTLLGYIFGENASVVMMIACYFFALIGILLNYLLAANKRDVQSRRTPFDFSYKFLIKDNLKTILSAVLLVFIFIRFSEQLTGLTPDLFSSFVIGLTFTTLQNKLIAMISSKK